MEKSVHFSEGFDFPFQITFRGFPTSDAVIYEVESQMDKLQRLNPGILSCHVVISKPHIHSNKGTSYHIEIKAHLAGKHIMITREPEKDDHHSDIYVAIHDAFSALERKIKRHRNKQKGHIKSHRHRERARILKLFAKEGYGFLVTRSGREIYFDKNSILNRNFDSLKIGEDVNFLEEPGVKGPHVTSMKVE